MIKTKFMNGKSRIALTSIIEVAGAKPYVVKQLVQRLVNNKVIESPYINQSEQWVDEKSFLVLSEQLGIAKGHHIRVVEAFNDVDGFQ